MSLSRGTKGKMGHPWVNCRLKAYTNTANAINILMASFSASTLRTQTVVNLWLNHRNQIDFIAFTKFNRCRNSLISQIP